MPNFKWSKRSLNNMVGIHPDLRRVADLALSLSPIDFIITEGARDIATQRKYVRQGKSKTMNSRHLYGLAIDYVDVGGSYSWERMKQISMAFKEAAEHLQIPIEWGGDWKTFKDTPHIQLSAKKYPNTTMKKGKGK